ncbi:unnamed protein product [Rhizophagus irregularis]|nr:unnamed protein product [Rhizophagus irregularis]CAB5200353.1 unnamed protein product [Rhizophagus irregularis]
MLISISTNIWLIRLYNFSYYRYKDNILPTEPYTSDDTKEIETRPLKRNDRTFDNSRSYSTPKRSCLDTLPALDSKQAGSSK